MARKTTKTAKRAVSLQPKKAKRCGRPKKPITERQLGRLASICCTIEEAAAVLGISRVQLHERLKIESFRDAWDEGQAKAKESLRRHQFKAAKAGNTTMLIWLGKQLLGQKDKPESEISGPNGGPLSFVVVVPPEAESEEAWEKESGSGR